MSTTEPAARNVLARAVLIAFALVILALPAAAVAGGYFPTLPVVGRFTAYLTTALPAVAVGALVSFVLAGVAIAIGGGRFTKLFAALALLMLGGVVVAGAQLSTLATQHGATFSLARQISAPAPPSTPDDRVVFATVDGIELEADLWIPSASAPGAGPAGTAALVFVHGGAFVGGELGSRPGLFAALADAGYAVVDIEYRLAPPPRWHDAPADVLCALAWLAEAGSSLGIDTGRVVLMGESAGGSLALVAGYAAGTDAVGSSCAGTPLTPAGIVAIAPAADLEGIWSDRTLWYGDRPFPEAYVGGPPSDFPDRYASASPFALIRAGLPPTLIITGANDHLVLPIRVTSLADRLAAGGVDTSFIVVPFADHGFDGPENGFGAQLLETVVPSFMADVTR